MIEMIDVNILGQWKLGIGDHSILGWTTTIGYFIAAALCGWHAFLARKANKLNSTVHRPSNYIFWCGLAIFMVLMGFNKQLDLQIPLVRFVRQISQEQGWFAERDAVRKWIILGSAFVGLILIACLGWKSRRVWRRYILPIVGIALLIFFVLVRASGDRLMILGYRPGHFPMYDILEVSGILCIGISAFIELRRCRKIIM